MPSAMARKANVRTVRDYERRRPERTLLYQLVEQYYPRFRELLAIQGRSLPAYVQRKFDDFLKCGILEHGFLRVRCQDCHDEGPVAFSCKRRGFCPSCGPGGWWKARRCWWTRSCPGCPCASGC